MCIHEKQRVQDAIQAVLERPRRNFTKEEAVDRLKEIGILDENGEIVPEYRGILVKRQKEDV